MPELRIDEMRENLLEKQGHFCGSFWSPCRWPRNKDVSLQEVWGEMVILASIPA
jgi:hypothetical protein